MTGDEALAAIRRVELFAMGLRGAALGMNNKIIAGVLTTVADNLDKVIKGQQI